MLSLPDWAFYPLAALAAGGMIATAVSFGDSDHRTPEEIRAEGIVYEGPLLAALTVGNGLEVEHREDDGVRYARITATRGPLDGIQSAGAFFTLSEEALDAFSGYRLNVRFTLRGSAEMPADATRLNLFSPGRSQGDWERVPLLADARTYEIGVEPATCDLEYGYIGVWPDWSAGANAIELIRVTVTVQEPLDCD